MVHRNPEKVPKIINALNLKVLPRDLNSKNPRHLLNVIFSQWLPLAPCTIQAVIDIVPPPNIAQRARLPKIVYPDLSEETTEPKNKLEEELWACSAKDDSFVVAYVSKMFAVQKTQFPEYKDKMKQKAKEKEVASADGEEEKSSKDDENQNSDDNEESDEALLGFSRIYSGRIKVRTRIAAILPKYDTSFPPTHRRNRKYIKLIRIEGLYTMMGRDLVSVEEVSAGNVFAIAGLDGFVGRSATLCAPSTLGFGDEDVIKETAEVECLINLGKVHSQIAPIVRVALEPAESGI
jgi:ribosome assembly protein 1